MSPKALRLLGGAVAVAAVLLLTTWPLALHPASRLLGLPDVEAVEHLWTLWLGLEAGPVVIDTPLASYPYGYRWVLADPLNLAWFALGALWSSVVGFHLVHLGNLLLCGLAAVVAGRALLPGEAPPAWATAALTVGAVPLAGNLLTGMSEAQTLWAALLAVALLPAAMERGGRAVAVAGLVGGLTAWGGPYTALYAAMLAPVVLLFRLPGALRAHGPRALARLAGVVLLAGVLAAPVLWAVATQRPDGLPGTESMTAVVLAGPEQPHNRYLGADLLGLLWPVAPPDSPLVHATYLGVGVLLLAAVGLVANRAGLMLVAVVWTAVLGLGFYLQVAGQVPRVDGRVLLLPAGWLSLVLEPLGRAARWHRFLSLTAMLLAPLAAAGAWRLVGRLRPGLRTAALALLVAACVADQLWASPLPWPRPTQDASPHPIYAALPEPGPIMIVPKQPRRLQDLPRSPALPLLWQTQHGMPIAERPMYQKTDERLHDLREDLRIGAKLGNRQRAEQGREGLRALGYGWIVHHVERGNTIKAEELTAVLGEPDVQVPGGMAWRP